VVHTSYCYSNITDVSSTSPDSVSDAPEVASSSSSMPLTSSSSSPSPISSSSKYRTPEVTTAGRRGRHHVENKGSWVLLIPRVQERPPSDIEYPIVRRFGKNVFGFLACQGWHTQIHSRTMGCRSTDLSGCSCVSLML
jgi:hypothetical protein